MDLAQRQMTGVFAIYNIKGEMAEAIVNATALEMYLLREMSAGTVRVNMKETYSEDSYYQVKIEASSSDYLERAVCQMQTALYTLESMRIAHHLQTTMFKAA